MIPWNLWTEKPPSACVAELRRGRAPFGVVALWLHRAVHASFAKAAPFMVRAAREVNPSIEPPQVVRATLQPLIAVAFDEWVRTQASNENAHEVVTAFCQMCADCVVQQMQTRADALNAHSSTAPLN